MCTVENEVIFHTQKRNWDCLFPKYEHKGEITFYMAQGTDRAGDFAFQVVLPFKVMVNIAARGHVSLPAS